jgi:hypothetical protein
MEACDMTPDLFTLAIEQRDRRIAELESRMMQKDLALANALSYIKKMGRGESFYQLGVRKQLRNSLDIAA